MLPDGSKDKVTTEALNALVVTYIGEFPILEDKEVMRVAELQEASDQFLIKVFDDVDVALFRLTDRYQHGTKSV